MRFIKIILATLGVVGLVLVASPVEVQALDIWNAAACGSNPDAEVCKTQGSDANMNNIIKTITSTLLFLLGAVAVIMIIFSGFKYVTSSGDQTRIASAKNTLMYSVVGLVVAVAAYAIVDFVLSRL